MATIILANSDSDTDYGTDSDHICPRHLPSTRRSKGQRPRIGDGIGCSPDVHQSRSRYCGRVHSPSPRPLYSLDEGRIMFAPSANGEYHVTSPELESRSRRDSTLPYRSDQSYKNGDQEAADYSFPANLPERCNQFTALEADFRELEQKDRSARAMLYAMINTALEIPEEYTRENSGMFDSTLSQLQRLSIERTELISGMKDAMIATFFKKITSRVADHPESEESVRNSTEPEASKTATSTTTRKLKANDRSGRRRASGWHPASDSEGSESPPPTRKPKPVQARKSSKPDVQDYED